MFTSLGASEELKRRAQVLLGKDIRFIHDPCFNLPNAASFILVFGMLGGDGEYVDEMPLLTRGEEGLLFRQLNFAKRQAWVQQRKIDLGNLCGDVMDEMERWLGVAERTRDRVVLSNQRLVKSVAGRFANSFSPDRQLDNLVSEGNVILIRAIEKFDWRRGNKFGTYATWALRKGFAKYGGGTARIRERERLIGQEFLAGVVEQDGTGERCYRSALEALRALRSTVLYELDDRERLVIGAYFEFLEKEPRSLAGLGRKCGFSRQTMQRVKAAALGKLYRAARRLGIEPP